MLITDTPTARAGSSDSELEPEKFESDKKRKRADGLTETMSSLTLAETVNEVLRLPFGDYLTHEQTGGIRKANEKWSFAVGENVYKTVLLEADGCSVDVQDLLSLQDKKNETKNFQSIRDVFAQTAAPSGRLLLALYAMRFQEIRVPSLAFQNNQTLTTIEVPFGFISIGDDAFSGCSSLIDVKLPDSINTIGKRAFAGCTSLTRIVMPANLRYIDDFTFLNCSSLQTVRVPDDIGFIKKTAFEGCPDSLRGTLPENN